MLSLSNQTVSPLRRRISANSWAAAVSTPAWLRKTWPSAALAIQLGTISQPIDQSQDRADGGNGGRVFLPQTLRVRPKPKCACSLCPESASRVSPLALLRSNGRNQARQWFDASHRHSDRYAKSRDLADLR